MISDSKIGKLYEVTTTFCNYETCFRVGDFLVYLEEKELNFFGAMELIFLSPQRGRVSFYAHRSSISAPVWFSYLREIPGDDE